MVCVYIYIYLCVCVYIYICVCVYIYLYMCLCVCVSIYIYICCVCVCIYIYLCVCVSLCVCISIYVWCVSISISIGKMSLLLNYAQTFMYCICTFCFYPPFSVFYSHSKKRNKETKDRITNVFTSTEVTVYTMHNIYCRSFSNNENT